VKKPVGCENPERQLSGLSIKVVPPHHHHPRLERLEEDAERLLHDVERDLGKIARDL
jgi:hypothetical protein